MYVTEGNVDYEIHQGEVLFLKSGIRHFSKRLTPGGTKWFYAHFFADRSVFPEYNSGMPAGEYNIPLPKKANVSGDYIRKLIAFSNGVHALAPDMILKHNSSFYELLTELVFLSNAETETLSDKICAFLDTQFNKPFTKELIEDRFFLSYSYMSAVFRREKGSSPGKYHNKIRMQQAAEMLRSTSIGIREIASELGFDDMLYFSRRFRQYYGMSPSQYRKVALLKY